MLSKSIFVKENRISKFFNDELEISSDESDYSDESDEENVMQKPMKKTMQNAKPMQKYVQRTKVF